MTAIRELLLRLAIGNLGVIQQVKDLKQDAKEIGSKPINVRLTADSKQAETGLQNVRRSLTSAALEAVKLKLGLATAAQGLNETGSSGSRLDTVMTKLKTNLGNVSTSFRNVAAESMKSVSSIRQNWSQVEGDLTKVAAVASGISLASVYMSANVQANMEAIEGTRGKEFRESYEPWVKEGKGLSYSSEVQRSQMAMAASRYFRYVSFDDQKLMLERLEKEAVREGKKPGDVTRFIELLGQGKLDNLIEQLPGIKVDATRLQTMAERNYEDPRYMRGRKSMSLQDVKAEMFMKEFDKWASTSDIEGVGKTLDEIDVSLDPLAQMQTSIEDISTTIGDTLKPALITFVSFLETANKLMQENPGPTAFLAISIALIGLAASSIVALAALKASLTALGLIPIASKLAAGGIGLIRVAFTLLAGHPIVAILLIVAMVLLYVAQRTGLLSKAFEVAGDVASGLAGALGTLWGVLLGEGPEMAREVIDGLIGALLTLWDLGKNVGGGLVSKLGGGGLKIPLTMMAMPALLTVGIGIKLITEILKILGSAGLGIDSLNKYAETGDRILGDILRLLRPFINVLMYIHKVLSDFWTWVQTLPEQIRQILPEYMKGESPEQAEQKNKLGLMGFGTSNDQIAAKLKYMIADKGSADEAEWQELMKLTGGDQFLYMPKYLKLLEENPDLMNKFFRRSGTQTIPKSDLKSSTGIDPSEISWPELPSGGNPVSGDINMPNVIPDAPEGIDIRTKNPEDVHGSADVEGGLQFYGRKVVEKGQEVKDWIGLDVGGQVIEDGPEYIHQGEEVDPARVVRGGETVLEKMTRTINGMMAGAQFSQTKVVQVINHFHAPLIDADRIEVNSDMDLDELTWKIRNKLDENNNRTTALLRA